MFKHCSSTSFYFYLMVMFNPKWWKATKGDYIKKWDTELNNYLNTNPVLTFGSDTHGDKWCGQDEVLTIWIDTDYGCKRPKFKKVIYSRPKRKTIYRLKKYIKNQEES